AAPQLPLRIVESIRLAIDRGVLVRRVGRWERTGEIEDAPLDDVLAARVAGMPPDACPVAVALAVAAGPVTVADLAAIAGVRVSELAAPLRALVRTGFVAEDLDPHGGAQVSLHDRYAAAALALDPAAARAAHARA